MAKARRKKAKEQEPVSPALHIQFNEQGIPSLSVDGQWSYMGIIAALQSQENWLWLKIMENTVDQAFGNAERVQQILDQMEDEDEAN